MPPGHTARAGTLCSVPPQGNVRAHPASEGGVGVEPAPLALSCRKAQESDLESKPSRAQKMHCDSLRNAEPSPASKQGVQGREEAPLCQQAEPESKIIYRKQTLQSQRCPQRDPTTLGSCWCWKAGSSGLLFLQQRALEWNLQMEDGTSLRALHARQKAGMTQPLVSPCE